jgi:hypothetical protein
MSDVISEFNPKVHICKFGFELYDHAEICPQEYKIIVDLYLMEVKILFVNKRTKEIVDAIGFKMSSQELSSLLPLIKWQDFEKIRDLPFEWDWDSKNGYCGYRDGWEYIFWCLSESGMPMIQKYMNTLFDEKMLPPHEKLMKWLRINYSSKVGKENKKVVW